MNFDEQPVGQHKAMEVAEHITEGEENSGKAAGPLSERVKSKNPKVRVDAMYELLDLLNSSESETEPFLTYSASFPKFLADKHPGVQEKAIDCFLVVAMKSPIAAEKNLSNCLKILLEKCITAAKAQIKSKSTECFLVLAEVENTHSLLKETLKEYLSLKTAPKVSAGAISILTQLVGSFGNSYFPIREFVKLISSLGESTNAQVRAEVMNYFKEAYRWDKDNVLKEMDKLRAAQQEELKKQFAEIVELPKPSKFVKGKENLHEEPQSITLELNTTQDMYAMATEVAVLSKFGDKWCSQIMQVKKWSEKRDKLEELLKAISVEKVKNDNFSELGKTLKLLLQDSNIVVVNVVLKIIGQMAKVLRSHFTAYSKMIFEFLVQKLKDKKSATEALKCMESLMYSLKIEDMIEQIKEALGDKSHLVKARICTWIETAVVPHIENTKGKIIIEEIGPILIKLTEDATSEVRDNALSCLAIIQKTLGPDTTLDKLMAELNTLKQEKIKQIQLPQEEQKVEVSKPIEKKDDSLGRTVSKKQLSLVKDKPKKVSTEETPVEEDVGVVMDIEEADKLVIENIPEEICTLLNEKDWKERQKAFQDLSEWVKENKVQTLLEPMLVVLKAKLNNFKESNPGLLKSGLALIQVLADVLTFNKKVANEIVPHLIDKMADTKLTTLCTEIIMAIADSANPSFVVNLLMKTCYSSKNPNTIKTSIALLTRMQDEYTVNNIPVKATVDFAKHYLNHTNSQIRNAAIGYLTSVYGVIGDVIQPWLADGVKDSVRKTMEVEFAKVKPQEVVEVKRSLKGESNEVAAKNKKKDIDSIVPRVNISNLITSKILSDLEDSTMKQRQEAKDAIEKILVTANNRILPTGLSPLINTLKGRMNEPCKNLAKAFITLVGNLALALGPAFKQYNKILIQPLMYNLTDKQTAIHGETIIAIDKIASVIGQEHILNNVPLLLEKENPEMRSSLLNWILTNKEHLEKCEVQALIGPLIAVMQDRSKEIRALGKQVLKEVINHTGYQAFSSLIQDLKPVVKERLEVVIEKYKPKRSEDADNRREATADMEEPSNKTAEPTNEEVEVEIKNDGNAGENKAMKEEELTSENEVKKEEMHTSKSTLKLPPSLKQNKSPPQRKNLMNSRCSMERSPGEMLSSKSTSNLQKRFEGRPKEVKKISRKLSRAGKKITSQSPSRSRVDSSSNGFAVETVVLATLGNKEKRDEADKQLRWSATEIREEHVEKLKKALKNVIHPNLFDLMFSSQFKKNLSAINILIEGLKGEFAAILDLVDLFLKWITVKMIDQSNTAMTKSIIEFLTELFKRMEEANYTLYDFEAAAILPMLCERVSTVSKELIKSACKLYNPSKVANHIVNTLESTKNLKTKLECLGILRELSEVFGSIKICSPKCIKIVVKLIGAGDKGIKSEAVEVLAEVYKSRGESIWTIINRIPEKHKEILCERFGMVVLEETEQAYSNEDYSNSIASDNAVQKKVLAENTNRGNAGKLNDMRSSLHVEKNKVSAMSEKAVESMENKFNATGRINFKSEDTSGMTERVDKKPIDCSGMEFESIESVMEVLKTGEISKRVDALMCLNEKIISGASKDKELLVNSCDSLFRTFAIVLKDTFDKQVSEIPIRFSKYFMTVISKICADKSITKKLTIGPYLAFAEQLLTKLLYDGLEKLGESNEGEYLIKTFNSTMLRLLENCDPTNSFSILIMLFKTHKNEPEMVGNIKMGKLPNLIVKCILKLTKVMDSFILFLDIPSLIICIHENLLTEVKRTVNGDIGIRMAKTIINELVKAKGEKIWESYKMAEVHIKDDDHIKRWIGIILQNTSKPFDSSLIQPEQLKDTMKLLSSQKTFKEGIRSLGEYVSKNKEVELEPYFSSCSKDFRGYVMEALKNYLETEGKEESKEEALKLNDGPRSSLLEYKSKLALLKQKFGVNDKEKSSESKEHTKIT
jgi:hypothetical protein